MVKTDMLEGQLRNTYLLIQLN